MRNLFSFQPKTTPINKTAQTHHYSRLAIPLKIMPLTSLGALWELQSYHPSVPLCTPGNGQTGEPLLKGLQSWKYDSLKAWKTAQLQVFLCCQGFSMLHDGHCQDGLLPFFDE